MFSCIFLSFDTDILFSRIPPFINFNEFFVTLEIANTGKPPKKRKPDDAWEHAIPLDERGEATRCKYCGFVSKCGGIARMKAHLGGGDLAMQVDYCPNVSPEIRNFMAGGKKKYKKKPKVVLQGTAQFQHKTVGLVDQSNHLFDHASAAYRDTGVTERSAVV